MQLGRIFRTVETNADAAFRRQEIQHVRHHLEIHAIDDLSSMLFLHNEIAIDQHAQVMGKRGSGYAHVLANITDRKAIIASLHKQPEDRKACLMSESRQGFCILIHHHDDQYNYISSFVNMMPFFLRDGGREARLKSFEY